MHIPFYRQENNLTQSTPPALPAMAPQPLFALADACADAPDQTTIYPRFYLTYKPLVLSLNPPFLGFQYFCVTQEGSSVCGCSRFRDQ